MLRLSPIWCVRKIEFRVIHSYKSMAATSVDMSQLAFSALWTNNKGAKQLPALYEKSGEAVIWQPDEFLEMPFEQSSYADLDAIRVTLCLNPRESVCETIAKIEEWCIATLSKNPTTLLGVQMTEAQVRERYVSCIKTSDKGWKL